MRNNLELTLDVIKEAYGDDYETQKHEINFDGAIMLLGPAYDFCMYNDNMTEVGYDYYTHKKLLKYHR